jgi:hypothetical protein
MAYIICQGSSRKPVTYVTDLTYADDVALASHVVANTQITLTAVEQKANPTGLFVNKIKTEALITPTPEVPPPPLSVSTGTISLVTDFNYLGSTIPDLETDLKRRIGQAWSAFKNLWKSSLNKLTKVHVFSAVIVPFLFYANLEVTRTLSLSCRKLLYSTYNKMLRSILQIQWRQHISNKELHRRAGVLSPAAQITRRTLKFVGSILAGPPQVAKTLLKWQHNYTRRRQYKRRLSYPEQIRYMTGEREAISPMTKKARLLEIMDYLSDPAGVNEAISNIPSSLEDFLDLSIDHMQLDVFIIAYCIIAYLSLYLYTYTS